MKNLALNEINLVSGGAQIAITYEDNMSEETAKSVAAAYSNFSKNFITEAELSNTLAGNGVNPAKLNFDAIHFSI